MSSVGHYRAAVNLVLDVRSLIDKLKIAKFLAIHYYFGRLISVSECSLMRTKNRECYSGCGNSRQQSQN